MSSKQAPQQADDVQKQPPHSEEAEQMALSAMMVNDTALSIGMTELKAESLYYPAHRLIWQAMERLYTAGTPVDLVTVSETLRFGGKLDEIGGYSYLLQIHNAAAATANIGYWLRLIRDAASNRSIASRSYRIYQAAMDSNPDTLAMCQSLAEGASLADGKAKAVTARESVEQALAAIDRAAEGVDATRWQSGYFHLDRLTGGFGAGDLVIVAARPSMGKSALSLNIAANMAEKAEPVLIVSQEMTADALTMRLLSRYSEMPYAKIRAGAVWDDEKAVLIDAAKRVAELPILIDDNPEASINHVRARVAETKRKFGKISGVIVDHIGLMSEAMNAKDSSEEGRQLGRVSAAMKAIAKEYGCPAFVLCQLNRKVEERSSKKPMLSDLRQSGKIEENADIVMMLYRDEYYNSDSKRGGELDIIIAKNREGETGTCTLVWDAKRQSYSDVSGAQF